MNIKVQNTSMSLHRNIELYKTGVTTIIFFFLKNVFFKKKTVRNLVICFKIMYHQEKNLHLFSYGVNVFKDFTDMKSDHRKKKTTDL